MRDLYSILGISPMATSEQIKAAFRSKAKEHHPDRGGDARKFQEIVDAYEKLQNSGSRSKQDIDHDIGDVFGDVEDVTDD